MKEGYCKNTPTTQLLALPGLKQTSGMLDFFQSGAVVGVVEVDPSFSTQATRYFLPMLTLYIDRHFPFSFPYGKIFIFYLCLKIEPVVEKFIIKIVN